jgi:hypothetical protein
MPWRRVLHIAAGVCSSLGEAHALGVVHRDLKPANIHLEFRDGDPDFVKVLDFGIAKIVQGTDLEHTQLTQAGQMIGTVDYMSPEQMVGGELTPASDIYTLGVVIYEMITGRTPFADCQSATAILAAVLTRAPDPLSTHARVPVLLDRIVARCLERDPQSRFPDVSDLVEALAEVAAGGAARHTPAAPNAPTVPARPPNEFAQPALTTEATRIDVRFNESSQPVLDARGARRLMPDAGRAAPAARARQVTPAPPAAVGHIQGSNNAIDVRAMPVHGSQHAIDRRAMPPGVQPAGELPPWSPPAVPMATPLRVEAMQPMPPAQAAPPMAVPPSPVMPRSLATPVPTLAGGSVPPPYPAMPYGGGMSHAAMSHGGMPHGGGMPHTGGMPHAAMPYAGAMPPAAMPPAAGMTPYPAPPAPAKPPGARGAVPVLPGSAMFPAVVPPPMQSPKPFFPIEPTVGAPRYSATFTAVSSYDMTAAARYDRLVRRIIWAAVIIAVLAAAVIALH